MKAFLVAALLVVSSTVAHAGRVKEIHIMTTESIYDAFSVDESMVQIDGYDFVQIEGEDLAVQTTVRFYDTRAVYSCVTIFAKTERFYAVKKLRCE